jgi:hypothetical protein
MSNDRFKRECQLLEAEIARLEHVRPSAEITVARAIDDRIVTLKHRLEKLSEPVSASRFE